MTEILINGEKPHGITFPRIYNDGNIFIGGYTELSAFLRPSYDYQKLSKLAGTLTDGNMRMRILDCNFMLEDSLKKE